MKLLADKTEPDFFHWLEAQIYTPYIVIHQ